MGISSCRAKDDCGSKPGETKAMPLIIGTIDDVVAEVAFGFCTSCVAGAACEGSVVGINGGRRKLFAGGSALGEDGGRFCCASGNAGARGICWSSVAIRSALDKGTDGALFGDRDLFLRCVGVRGVSIEIDSTMAGPASRLDADDSRRFGERDLSPGLSTVAQSKANRSSILSSGIF